MNNPEYLTLLGGLVLFILGGVNLYRGYSNESVILKVFDGGQRHDREWISLFLGGLLFILSLVSLFAK